MLLVLIGSDPIPGLLLDEFWEHDDWDLLLAGDPFAIGENPAAFVGNLVVFDCRAGTPETVKREYRGVRGWVPGSDLGRFQLDPRIEGVD